MISGKTKTGFEFTIPKERFNDMEVIDLLRDMQRAEEEDDGGAKMLFAVSDLALLLLGKDGKKKLYNHLRTESGQVPIDAVVAEVMDVFNSANAGN
ncbi:MAG: hypothetical protein IKZ66_03560 [Schwartzia sp.]|nr:hypothetical protein [Schwartzia sp. (in: firmicutes)]